MSGHLRQMMLGWRLYADDFNDLLVASLPGDAGQRRPVWVTGGPDYNPGNLDFWKPSSLPIQRVQSRTGPAMVDSL